MYDKKERTCICVSFVFCRTK